MNRAFFAIVCLLIPFALTGQTRDTIFTNINLMSYVVCPGPIDYVVVGNGKNLDYQSKFESAVLMIKPVRPIKGTINLMVKEMSGEIHYLNVTYKENLKVEDAYYNFQKKQSSVIVKTDPEPEKEAIKTIDTAFLKRTERKLLSQNPKFRTIAEKNGRVYLGITSTESSNGFFFVKIEVHNLSSIAYDPETIILQYVESGEEASILDLPPVYVTPHSIFEANSKNSLVYVVQQFGIRGQGRFQLYLKETEGNRNFLIKFPAKLLL